MIHEHLIHQIHDLGSSKSRRIVLGEGHTNLNMTRFFSMPPHLSTGHNHASCFLVDEAHPQPVVLVGLDKYKSILIHIKILYS